MVLAFSDKHKALKQKTEFVEKILAGRKLHTLRSGNRWKAGMTIHMATGVRTKHYNQFNKNRPDLSVCTGTQKIKLVMSHVCNECKIYVDGHRLSFEEMQQLAWNDGFCHWIEF